MGACRYQQQSSRLTFSGTKKQMTTMPAMATVAVLITIMFVVQVQMPLVDARRDLKTVTGSWSNNWNAGWSSSWSGTPVAVTAPGVNVNVAGQGQPQQAPSSGGGGGSSASSTASSGVYVTAPGTTVSVGGGGGGGSAGGGGGRSGGGDTVKGSAPGSVSGGGAGGGGVSRSSADAGTSSSSSSGGGGGGGGNGGVLVTAPGTVVTVGSGGGGGGGGGVQVKAPYTTVSVDSQSQAKTKKDSDCVAVSGTGQWGWGKGCRRSRNLQQVDVVAGRSGAVRVGNTVNVKWGRRLKADGTTVVNAPTTTVQDTSTQTNVRNPWADVTVNKGGNGGGCVNVPGTTTVIWGHGCTRP